MLTLLIRILMSVWINIVMLMSNPILIVMMLVRVQSLTLPWEICVTKSWLMRLNWRPPSLRHFITLLSSNNDKDSGRNQNSNNLFDPAKWSDAYQLPGKISKARKQSEACVYISQVLCKPKFCKLRKAQDTHPFLQIKPFSRSLQAFTSTLFGNIELNYPSKSVEQQFCNHRFLN